MVEFTEIRPAAVHADYRANKNYNNLHGLVGA